MLGLLNVETSRLVVVSLNDNLETHGMRKSEAARKEGKSVRN